MRFLLGPLPQNLTSYRGLVAPRRSGHRIQPYVYGFSDAEAKVFEGERHRLGVVADLLPQFADRGLVGEHYIRWDATGAPIGYTLASVLAFQPEQPR